MREMPSLVAIVAFVLVRWAHRLVVRTLGVAAATFDAFVVACEGISGACAPCVLANKTRVL